jgi:GTP-binding protein
VDLPGYGYAQVPTKIRATWTPYLEYYLMQRRQLHGVVMLLDARYPPTDLDLQMKEWLENAGISALVVVTKMDKISLGDQRKTLEGHAAVLGLSPAYTVLPFSAKTGAGKEQFWHSIQKLLRAKTNACLIRTR